MKFAPALDYCRSVLAASLRFWIRSEEKSGPLHMFWENTPEPYVSESTMRELCASEVSIFRDVSRSPAT